MAGYGAADAVGGLLRLGLAAWYSRLLRPDEFGVLAVIYVSVALIATVAALGLPEVLMVRFRDGAAAQMRRDKDRVYSAMAAACAATCGIAIGGATLVPGARCYMSIAPWCLLWVASHVLCYVPLQSMRFSNRVWQYGAARLSQVVALVAVLLWFVARGSAGL